MHDTLQDNGTLNALKRGVPIQRAPDRTTTPAETGPRPIKHTLPFSPVITLGEPIRLEPRERVVVTFARTSASFIPRKGHPLRNPERPSSATASA